VLVRTLHFIRKLLAEEEAGSSSPSAGARGEGFLRGEEGAAMVEFILIFPLQLTLTLAIIQFALLQYATLVVQQAADLSARAAAVHDVMGPGSASMPPNDAALRMAARQCALLAPGIRARYNGGIGGNSFGGTVPANGKMSWGGNGFSAGREAQAYGLMQSVTTNKTPGQMESVVTYDYLMSIPVGAQFLIMLNNDAWSRSDARGGFTVWPIKRTGRCVAPWVR
jgi:Flp pilus assembly pilin Flp